ncbi:MAG: hypothetical protein H6579_06100 [Chitinophagales bacterium]|nr:hypothetical protein [Bacteroidota bacterium]MCB9256682.1 hypothetical protein [Chitinophagales bacterium]
MKVAILGMGSKECLDLQIQLQDMLNELHSEASVKISDDIDLFIQYKIKKTPALLVNQTIIPNSELKDLVGIRQILKRENAIHDNNQEQE